MKKYRVLQRDHSAAPMTQYVEVIIETEETKEELLRHSHIIEVLEEIVETKAKEVKEEEATEEVKTKKKK